MKCLLIFIATSLIYITTFSQGFVGINTITPSAMLHVKDSNVLFSGPASLPGNQGNPPASGGGVRLMWYPNKAAFRAGQVTNQNWEKDSIGSFSVAMGSNTKAKGTTSTALGQTTTASGTFSTAMGNVTMALGQSSTSMGEGTIAIGHQSTAMGYQSIASGNRSLAIGSGNTARAFTSFTIGRYNDSIIGSTTNSWVASDPLFIIGNGSADDNRHNALTVLKNGKTGINTTNPVAMLHVQDSSVVFTANAVLPAVPGNPPVTGAGTRMMWYPDKAAFRVGNATNTQWDRDNVGQFSFAGGQSSTASGSHSFSFGVVSLASGSTSFAIGNQAQALGTGSVALGTNNDATGSSSLALGNFTTAAGTASTAMGNNTRANGSVSTAMGSNTVANGINSVSMGSLTTAIGSYSVASGLQTKSKPYASFVIGRYNDSSTISSTTWDDNDPLFIIGNGTSDINRNNAMTVLKNGNTGINIINPATLLHVVKGSEVTGPTHSNSVAILESNVNSYLQFSSINNVQSGILSGNEETSIRNGLIFNSDSSVQVRAGGNITRYSVDKDGNSNTTGEIRRTSTGTANMVPICYGTIGSTAIVTNGSGNFSVATTGTGVYEITITGETYTTSDYTTVTTPISALPRFVSTQSSAGKLVVRTFTSASAAIDLPFHFVVYKD